MESFVERFCIVAEASVLDPGKTSTHLGLTEEVKINGLEKVKWRSEF